MRTRWQGLIALTVCIGWAVSVSAQSKVLPGSVKPVKVKFKQIDMSRLSAPIPPFPGSKETKGLGALRLYGKNTPGFAQGVANSVPNTLPTPKPVSDGSGLFGLTDRLRKVTKGFFNRNRTPSVLGPAAQEPINPNVFTPSQPFTPR